MAQSETTYGQVTDVPADGGEYIFIDAGSDLKGESKTDGFADQIVAYNVEAELTMPLRDASKGSGGRTAGKPSTSNWVISKVMDLSSTGWAKNLVQGKSIDSIKITWVRYEGGAAKKIREVTLKKAMVAGVKTGGWTDMPVEQITVQPGEIEDTYTQQDETATAKGSKNWGYNFLEGKSA